MNLRNIYYSFKPVIPRRLQLLVRRVWARKIRAHSTAIWPIDPAAAPNPQRSTVCWPQNKSFALVLTHDVDTLQGAYNCEALAEIERELGFRSSFNFVPERYPIPDGLFKKLRRNGFEIGVHGLKHDGKLFKSHEIFSDRAVKINNYIKAWAASGFRSPAMHHNLQWLHQLKVVYDASTFDTDPFEPQPDGVKSIFPFIVTDAVSNHQYVELPYTLAQDFTLFILLQEKNISIWTQKLDWIVRHQGMALINTHPDYMHFDEGNGRAETYPVQHYVDLLHHIKKQHTFEYWHVLPAEIARFWNARIANRQHTEAHDIHKIPVYPQSALDSVAA